MCHVECHVTDVPMRMCNIKHVHESDDIFDIFFFDMNFFYLTLFALLNVSC